MTEIPELLKPDDVARILKVKPVTVYSWARKGKIPCYQFERCIRFDVNDVKEFIQQKRNCRD